MFYPFLRPLQLVGFLLLFSVLAAAIAVAQTSPVPTTTGGGLPQVAAASGLSFRYVQTLGEVSRPYLVDTTHLNRPHGLFIDQADNLYVTEENGRRVLSYSPAGANLRVIGKATGCYTADNVFCTPYDVTTDPSGNLWVADGNRIVQYSSAGALVQQLPTQDPWEPGADNTHFEGVHGIALSPSGLLFVADTYNHRVQVYTLAGGTPTYSATIGVVDQSGADAQHFNQPYRLAVDSQNRLYVVDQGNNRVQRCILTTTWNCTTALSGLKNPHGIAVGPGDAIYVADTENGRIAQCQPLGACQNFAVDLAWPYDVAVASNGTVYAAAADEEHIYQLASSGAPLGTFVGVIAKPYLTDNLHYNRPRLALDKEGNLLIVEEAGHRVVKVDPNGKPLWAIGEPGVPGYDNAHFAWPRGVATDSAGNVYVADGTRVQIFTGNGVYVATLGEGWGTGPRQFSWVTGVAVDGNGLIYVSDGYNHRIQVYDRDRQYVATLGVTGANGSDNAHFNLPVAVAVDATGNLYVADRNNCRVQKFNASRVYQRTFGTAGSCSSNLLDVAPEAVTIDAQGRVYIGDWYDRVQVFAADGSYLTTVGEAWGERPGELRGASSVAVDKLGNLYVADFENARIQIFAPGTPGWQQTNLNGFGERSNEAVTALEVFNGQLFAGVTNYTYGGTVWRSSDGASWQRISEPGFTAALSTTNPVIFDLIEFQGALYAGTGVWWADGIAGQVWRTTDGQSWTQVVDDGFGNAQNDGVVAFGTFQELLYAVTMNSVDGLEIWRSSTGNRGDWTRVVTGGFGAGKVQNIGYSLQEFAGHLYVGVESNLTDGSDGLLFYRTADGVTWTPVNAAGFGEKANKHPGGLVVFQNMLYAGTRNDTAGSQLWRSSDGQQWTQVVAGGFADPNNTKIDALVIFGNQLYAVASNAETGVEVWRTPDGDQWTQVNGDGFGSRSNEWTLWGNATTVFTDSLYIGAANYAVGATIWRADAEHASYLPLVTR